LNKSTKPARKQPKLEDFPHRVTDNIRYGDLDAQGHVNNTVFAGYFETGRVTMFCQPDLSIGIENATVVLAHTEITFLLELHWPGTIEIGTAVTEIGRSSYTLAHAVFRDGACAAFGRATVVLIDESTRRARPLPEELMARLKPWAYRGE
jgi:acyl-CoA thioester hydrolase